MSPPFCKSGCSEAHVLVLLSDFEGLPIALMEGMACGLVPVCFKMRSGIPELVEDGVTGLLVSDRGDEFVRAIARLHNDRNLWERLSLSARSRIAADYSLNACAEKWMDLPANSAMACLRQEHHSKSHTD